MSLDRLPHDRQLAKRLVKQSRAAAKARARAELAYAQQLRRRQRALRKARQRLPWHGAVLVSATVATFGFDAPTWVGVAGVVGLFGVLRHAPVLIAEPPAAPPPFVVPSVPSPPPPRSAAFPAVRRLEAVHVELARLLPLVAPGGRDVAEEAWQAAGEADTALRWQAARLAAVEPHRGADPELLGPLHEGVARQERLLAAVADLVVASADPIGGTRLRDATDAVQGLAAGLREVR